MAKTGIKPGFSCSVGRHSDHYTIPTAQGSNKIITAAKRTSLGYSFHRFIFHSHLSWLIQFIYEVDSSRLDPFLAQTTFNQLAASDFYLVIEVVGGENQKIEKFKVMELKADRASPNKVFLIKLENRPILGSASL